MSDVITGILIRSGKNNNKEIQTQSGDDHHMVMKLGIRVWNCKPRNAKDCWQPLKDRRGRGMVLPCAVRFPPLDTFVFRCTHLLNGKGIMCLLF